MTAPATADAGGLSDATGASVGIVLDSIGGAIGSTVGVVIVPVAIGAGVLLLAVLVVLARRFGLDIAEGLRQPDPREGYDPTASTVLGEW